MQGEPRGLHRLAAVACHPRPCIQVAIPAIWLPPSIQRIGERTRIRLAAAVSARVGERTRIRRLAVAVSARVLVRAVSYPAS